jgi:hypothetical protein
MVRSSGSAQALRRSNKDPITWNKPDGAKPTEVLSINADDPDRDDLELQFAKAKAAASVLFNGKYPKHPPAERLSAQVLKWSFTRAIVWLGIFRQP